MTNEQQLELLGRQLLALAQAANKSKLRPGYYSIDETRYIIDVPSQGKWKDWTFLKTGSDYHENRLMLSMAPDGMISSRATDHARQVLARIMADPVAAMLEYASITGRCGVCGRKLEDPTSVALGIGPVCIQRLIGG